MSRKLLPSDFIDLIAQNQGITKKKSEAFIRAFFEVIEAGLQNDSFVKIKGFGTFKLVNVSERESVNINTGERFQISGHTKVSFLPDTALKELINRPFSHFETCVIPDSATIEEIESIEDDVQEEVAFNEEQTNNEEELLIQEHITEATTNQPLESLEEREEPSRQEETTAPEETIAPEALTNPEETTPTEETTPLEETTPIESPAILVDSTLIEMHTEEESTDTLTLQEQENPQNEVAEDRTSSSDNSELNQTEDNNDSSSDENYMDTTNKSHKFRWLLIGFIWILTIIISYLAGYHKIIPLESISHHETQQTVVKDTIVNTAQEDSIKIPTDSVISNTPQSLLPEGADTLSVIRGIDRKTADKLAEEQKQVNVGSFLIIGTYATHVLRPGDTLYQIARKTYGHKDYAKYIILYNNLTPPYNLPLGTELLLPQLVEKEEFADTPKIQ